MQVMILITGAQKSFALYKTIEEGVNHMWTASCLQQHANVLLICDDDATLELRVKTVKYFKVRDDFELNARFYELMLCVCFALSFYRRSQGLMGVHSKLIDGTD